MGEAKRRKAAVAERSYREIGTGKPVTVRQAGDPVAFWSEKQAVGLATATGRRPEAKVPCGGCRECCWHIGVDVYPALERPEDLAHMDMEWRPETESDVAGWYLRRREDGACVHLGPTGCTIYQHRPIGCRTYDCRLYALFGVLDAFEPPHAQPAWEFNPNSHEGRALMATCKVMGITALRRLRAQGVNPSAHDVAQAIMQDLKSLDILYRGFLALAKASPAQQLKMLGSLGFNPSGVTKEQVVAAMHALAGEGAIVYERD